MTTVKSISKKSIEIQEILEASKQIRKGDLYTGNLRDIINNRKKCSEKSVRRREGV